MELNEVVAYFEDLAKRHKKILHTEGKKRFAQQWNAEVEQMFKNISTPFMVLNQGIGGLRYDDTGIVRKRRIGFEIHVPANRNTDTKSVGEALTLAERIGLDIIACIMRDVDGDEVCPRAFRNFEPDTVIFEHFESKMPNFMTCVFSFDIDDDDYITYNQESWL